VTLNVFDSAGLCRFKDFSPRSKLTRPERRWTRDESEG
jgi:hypothetical protein